MNSIRLLFNFMKISLKKESIYRFELFMTLIQLLFNLTFTLIFWYTLFQFIPELAGWQLEDLLFYTAVVFLGNGLAGIFFGFRDMPSRIVSGELDKYLTRPMNTMIALLFENVSVFYYIEQLIVSVLLMGIILWKYDISIILKNLPIAIVMLFVGVMMVQMLIGILTFLAFWFGRIEGIRNLFVEAIEVKQYPISIFPTEIRRFLTYIIPVYFVAYYPSAILLGKEKISFWFISYAIIFFLILLFLFQLIWKAGLRRYEANGG